MYGLLLCKNKKYIVRKIGLRHESRIVASNENRTLLLDIAKNLNLGFPKVRLNFINVQNNNSEGIITWLMEEDISSSIILPHKGISNDLPVNSRNLGDKTENVHENNDIQNNNSGSIITGPMEEDNNYSVILPQISNDLPSVNPMNFDDETIIVHMENNNSENNIDIRRSVEKVRTSNLRELYSDSDCDDDDPDYCEESADSLSSEDDYDISTRRSESYNEDRRISFETSLNASGSRICDDLDLHVRKSGLTSKQNFCCYCKTMQTKIARHLEYVHKDEEEVKKFSLLPKANRERQQLISVLRKKGNYLYNTDKAYNKGELIVCRRPSEFRSKTSCDFTCCAKCKGFFSKNNIRHHFQHCTGRSLGRSVKIMGRKVQNRIHASANKILRNTIFPVLREDNITRIIRYDELLIIYGNKLCTKYKYQHQHDMIRARLRLLGRFITVLKEINSNITDFFSIYSPRMYDDCIAAVNQVAGYDMEKRLYRAPNVASRLGTLLKQIGNIAIAEYIKRDKLERKTEVENFLKLHLEDFGTSINKTVEESILQMKRYNKQNLPLLEDIRRLHNYLLTNREIASQQLNNKYNYESWLNLARLTLVSIQVFNRRRPGELERITVEDYNHHEVISEYTYPEFYKTLSEESKRIANKYIRFQIRGKLGRTVPVLLDGDMKKNIDQILSFRRQANIPDANPYIFALPGYDKNRYKYLRACELLRRYSSECEAKMPLTLRGTKLRKHIATKCIALNLTDQEVRDLANHLGHEKSIHMRHYRQSIPEVEIIKISRLLEIAQGEEENKDDDENEDEHEENERINIAENFTIEELEKLNESSNNFSHVATTSSTNYTRKKRSSKASSFGGIKRVRWTQKECDAIFTAFKTEIKERRLPSGQQLQAVKEKYNCLNHRSIPQIRTWIHNIIRKKKK